MSVGLWIISISIGIVALAFLALVIFLGITLVSLRRTIADVDEKIHAFDPLFRMVSKTGETLERKASKRINSCCEEYEEGGQREKILKTALEVAEWSLVGVALWQKLKQRK